MNANDQENQEMSRSKKAVALLSAMFLSCVIAFLIAEIIVRLFDPQQEAQLWHASDENYGYVVKKNYYQTYRYQGSDYVMEVQTNSFGHRDEEYDTASFSDPDILKVMMLGDSFVFGYGVDVADRFDTIMDGLLDQSGIPHIVINAGVGGWGTLQEVNYARDHLELFHPDVIVLTFCGNDPKDDIMFRADLLDNEKGLFYFPGKIFLKKNSHLVRLVIYRFKKLLHNWALKKRVSDITEDGEQMDIDIQSASIITDDEWQRTIQYISDFHQDFIAHNPDGLLLVQATAPWDPRVRTYLGSLSNGTSLHYVDLYDDAISLKSEDRRLPYDGHWSKNMHTISARNIYDLLTHQRTGPSEQ